MNKFESKAVGLHEEITSSLSELVSIFGVKSEFSDERILKIDDDDMKLQIHKSSMYLVELNSESYFDNSGEEYSFSTIGIVELSMLVDYFESKVKTYKVSICRTASAFIDVEVKAMSEEQAVDVASDEAGDHLYSEKSADYSFPDGAVEI
jgi:hypothetical protein